MLDLLWPADASRKDAVSLSDATIADLGLLEIARSIAGAAGGEELVLDVLRNPPRDSVTIDHRRRILFDLHGNTAVCGALAEVLAPMRELTAFARAATESDSALLQAIWRLGELELYVECLLRLQRALEPSAGAEPDERSAGNPLAALAAEVSARVADPGFKELATELPRLRDGLQRRRSVTVGINLDERLRPVEAALVSINDRPFSDNTLLGTLLGRDNSYRTKTPMHRSPTAAALNYSPGARMPLSPLFRDIDKLLRDVARPLLRGVERYLRVNTAILRTIEPQLRFYIGAAELMRRLEGAGFAVCAAETAAAGERGLQALGAYNLHLALRAIATAREGGARAMVVDNDILFDAAHRVQILTGPNHGGKTTYLQAAGIIQILAQAGLFVPARHARFSPVDAVWTHFPVRESAAEPTGRFAEELQRLAEIVERVTPYSLVLCNESLSGTGPTEAVGISEELLGALRVLGVRTLFATHLHDLALRCERINASSAGPYRAVGEQAGDRAVSLRAEVDNEDERSGRRTYRIRFAPPYGRSYAHDVAHRHGLTYQQILTRFRERGMTRDP